METRRPKANPGHDVDPADADLRARWTARYGAVVAAQLASDRRYSVVKVGAVEFAYTTYETFVRALNDLWGAGLVPEPLPTASGSELLDVAPHLQGVDADLHDIRQSDIEPRSRFS
jgi:hypothetical protein